MQPAISSVSSVSRRSFWGHSRKLAQAFDSETVQEPIELYVNFFDLVTLCLLIFRKCSNYLPFPGKRHWLYEDSMKEYQSERGEPKRIRIVALKQCDLVNFQFVA